MNRSVVPASSASCTTAKGRPYSPGLTALSSGIFIVAAGGLADRFGRVKLTYTGLALSILGSLLIAISPSGTVVFLMAGRIIQGLSAACIMPATLALMKAYFDGADRQRAPSFWSIGSRGGSGVCSLFGGLVASSIGWRWIFWMSIVCASELYAVAALAGAAVVAVSHLLNLPPTAAASVGAAFCFGIRLVAIWRGWDLPVARLPEQSASGTDEQADSTDDRAKRF